jgi:hypothetical protein
MIADHTKVAAEFKTALQEAGIIPLKDSMGVGDLAKYEKLHLATASSFDGAPMPRLSLMRMRRPWHSFRTMPKPDKQRLSRHLLKRQSPYSNITSR